MQTKKFVETRGKLLEGPNDNGEIPILIISPGQGSSGYYTPEVLKEAAGLYKAGTHMNINHDDPAYRSILDIAAVLSTDAKYEENGTDGPGIYANCRVFEKHRGHLKDVWPYIGISHQVYGESEMGDVNGIETEIITKITEVESVDFVTHAGRGGKILAMVESQLKKQKESDMTDNKRKEDDADTIAALQAEVDKLTAEIAQKDEIIATLEAEIAALNAQDTAEEVVGKESRIPERARSRVVEAAKELAKKHMNAGKLNESAYKLHLAELVKTEAEFYGGLSEGGPKTGIKGHGSPSDNGTKYAEACKTFKIEEE